MISPTTAKGQQGEATAAAFLEREGYRVLQRNYRCRQGEIDIIAEAGEVLCFVEVRSCRSDAHGDPLETVNSGKRRRLIRAAQHYLVAHHGAAREIRFDVVGIVYQPTLRIQLVRGAFESNHPW